RARPRHGERGPRARGRQLAGDLAHAAPREPGPRRRRAEPALEAIERGDVPVGARAPTQARRQLLDDQRDLADHTVARRAADTRERDAGGPDPGPHPDRIAPAP